MTTKRNDKEDKTPPVPYSGVPLPAVPRNVDDMGEETTRKAAIPNLKSTWEPVQFQQEYAELAPPTFPNKDTSSDISWASVFTASKPLEIPYVPPAGWRLTDVPTLPEFYPLERTAVFVPKVSAAEVASRVTNILRERSIEATYDDASAKAKCVTADNVDFRVRMYRGRNQYSHGIIVEVQRRFGFSLNFHNDTIAILDAAEGKPPRALPSLDGLPCVSDDSDDEYDPSLSASSLEFASKMLHHPGYDAHSLALQTLSSLTDPAKMGRMTAENLSRALLEPGSEVGATVVSLVEDDKTDPEETFGQRLMAMTVLSNAIQAVSGNIPGSLWEKLRPIFINILRSADFNPQIAYLAARSIELLIKDDHNPTDLYAPLKSAFMAGQARHAALARQAALCLKRLETR